MRAIKFRAWDKINHIMYKNVQVGFDSINKKNICIIILNGYSIVDTEGNFELSQYTGLKDKNGKEIYEFDIVRDHDAIFIIKYHDRFCGFEGVTIDGLGGYGWDNDLMGMDQLEIIGNIYENPELIKNK